MPKEKEQLRVVLGEYQLIGKLHAGEFVELVLKATGDGPSPLDAIKFHQGGKTALVIRDKRLAKTLQDEDVFRIVLERVASVGETPCK